MRSSSATDFPGADDVARFALQRGRHLYSSPLGKSIAEAQELGQLARRSGLLTQVNLRSASARVSSSTSSNRCNQARLVASGKSCAGRPVPVREASSRRVNSSFRRRYARSDSSIPLPSTPPDRPRPMTHSPRGSPFAMRFLDAMMNCPAVRDLVQWGLGAAVRVCGRH